MTAPRPVIPPPAVLLPVSRGGRVNLQCESCPEQFPADEIGCQCGGHIRCSACLIDCPSCVADIRDSFAAELSMERGR